MLTRHPHTQYSNFYTPTPLLTRRYATLTDLRVTRARQYESMTYHYKNPTCRYGFLTHQRKSPTYQYELPTHRYDTLTRQYRSRNLAIAVLRAGMDIVRAVPRFRRP